MKNQLFATTVATPAILFSTLLLTTQNVSADSVTVADDGGLQLSITANRRPQSIDKTLASVTVITKKDFDKIQAHDVVDVLRLQQGISISRSGGSGSTTSVFIRGSEADQVLVIMDGVRVSSATTGSFNWGNILLSQIERIEIVRGPRAALYGSDAIGGVIEITTRKDFTPYVSLGYGKYATKELSAGFSGDFGKNHLAINISGEKSDGFSATNEKSGSFNADKDPHNKKGVSLSLSRQFNDRIKAGINLSKNKNKVDYDQGNTDSDLETVSVFMNSDISERWKHEVRASYTKNDSLSTSAYGESPYTTRRKELNVQHNYAVSNNTSIIIGGNYREDKGRSKNFDEKVDNKALYANINNKSGALNLDLSIRHDKHSNAGSKTTGQIAAGYDLSSKTTAYASYGTAFKAPNINELYYPGFGANHSYAGNENLKPETSKTFEVGIKTRIDNNRSLEMSLFNTDVKNLISYSGANNSAINNDKVKIKGLEVGYAEKIGKLDINLGLSLLNTKDDNGKRLRRRPDAKATVNLSYDISEQTRVGLDASVVSSRSDKDYSVYPSRDTTLERYGLLNLSLNQKVGKHAKIGLRLENVTNENYELAHGYNTPERGAYLTLTYSPK